MIANPATPSPDAVPQGFTLNDLLMHSSMEKEPLTTSAKGPSVLVVMMGLAVVLAIGAFIWLDPMRLFTPAEAGPPATAIVPSEPARSTPGQETIASPMSSPATKSVDVPNRSESR